MPFFGRPGDTLHMPAWRSPTEHLYIILTEPDVSGDILLVNLTSRTTRSDLTVVLQPGEHPYVIHESVINFADARILEHAWLLERVEAGYFQADEPLTFPVLKRVLDGVLRSSRTAGKIRAYYRNRQ